MVRVACETGQPVASILRQPAALTLWTYLELQDAGRIASLLERAGRYEGAGLTAAASWNGKEFARLEAGFRSELRRHPDPVVERARNAAALKGGLAIIERVSVIGGAKE